MKQKIVMNCFVGIQDRFYIDSVYLVKSNNQDKLISIGNIALKDGIYSPAFVDKQASVDVETPFTNELPVDAIVANDSKSLKELHHKYKDEICLYSASSTLTDHQSNKSDSNHRMMQQQYKLFNQSLSDKSKSDNDEENYIQPRWSSH